MSNLVWYIKTCIFSHFQMSDFIIENPSDTVIIMQVVTLALYPNPQIIVDLLSDK